MEATPTPGGNYDPLLGVWTLPVLGTGVDNRMAELRLQVLVGQNLLADPTAVLKAANQAEVTAPPLSRPVGAKTATNIVCASCIDWEIVSVESDSDFRLSPPDSHETRFIYHVRVANNGPASSEATLSATRFAIAGGGFGSVTLFPEAPVALSLDAGEARTVTFATDWLEGPDSTYTVSWKFAVSDVSLQDPVEPNTVEGTFTGEVGGGGGGGCSINGSRAIDPIWLLLLILTGIRCLRCRPVIENNPVVRLHGKASRKLP